LAFQNPAGCSNRSRSGGAHQGRRRRHLVNNLTVGTSGQDINLNSTSIMSGQTVMISSGTIIHSP
jgi:hypothetical protein